MKNGFTVCLAVLIAILIFVGIGDKKEETHTEYLRIHIRADSNDECDQEVKYKVKEKVVEYLTPYLSECDSKEKAESVLRSHLSGIESVADNVLISNGFNYRSSAKIREENFPTRVYGDLTLESGYYDALILNLGSGKGDNWWCVVYPPLCFTGSGNNYIYKSKIMEIIRKFYQEKERK